MNQDLILKDVTDPIVRENFARIQSFLTQNVLLQTNFQFYEINILKANDAYPVAHGLKFVPIDIIALKAEGDFNYYFRTDLTDRTNIYIAAQGPVRLRFLAGRYEQNGRFTTQTSFKFVAPVQKPAVPDPTTLPIPSDGRNYHFATPSTTWVINHNLGFFPSTEIFSEGGSEVEAEVDNISVNQVKVFFNSPTAGYARLI